VNPKAWLLLERAREDLDAAEHYLEAAGA